MNLYRIIAGSLRAKLMLAVAATTSIILAVFIVSVAIHERNDVLRTHRDFALKLAGSLANSKAAFVASNDVLRLQEIANAQNRYDDLAYAILTNKSGEILAHTDTTQVGLFLANLPKNTSRAFYIVQNKQLTDVLHPVFLQNKHVS